MAIRFSERWLERLPAPDPGKKNTKEYRDATVQGLGIRHYGPPHKEGESAADRRARSVITFFWRRTQDGKRVAHKLGRRGPAFDLDAAQAAATKWNVHYDNQTLDEEAATRRNVPTLTECYEAFKAEKAPHISALSLEGYDRLAQLFDDLGKVKITRISRDDLVQLHAEIGKTRKRTANRVLNLASRLWESAANVGKVKGRNPATGIQRFTERPRERVVTEEEWPRLFDAIDGFTAGESNNATEVRDIQDLMRVLIFTGCRKSNALSMAWEDIDLEAAVWTIPKSKAKGGRKMITIPLAGPVLEILKRRQKSAGEFVFPGPGKTGHMADPRKAWLRILKEAEIEGLTLHDLRRSFASMAYNRGAQSTIISDALGHSNVQSTESYTWSSNDAVRREVEETAREIEKAAQHST